MNHRAYREEDILSIYKAYYKQINGGIDGYYERTILDAQIYEVHTHVTLALFSVHPIRGLTSLVVLPEHITTYETIFSYVIGLPLFTSILFSGQDQRFLSHIQKANIPYEIQAYNFAAKQHTESSMLMTLVQNTDIDRIEREFGEFIRYNGISLESNTAFYYAKGDTLISFGALEPLRLNDKRFCMSMVVNESFRRRGYGSETVKFLVSFLESQGQEANARCYVHNEASRKTLIRSGLVITNVLYKAKKTE
ncbi:MAG: GNAT family N-acetyltransferase [Acholeplasmataceae bacterium]|nr:GNAT family N-acetyltransferase [Acholeplasmataceae bacterium]